MFPPSREPPDMSKAYILLQYGLGDADIVRGVFSGRAQLSEALRMLIPHRKEELFVVEVLLDKLHSGDIEQLSAPLDDLLVWRCT